jgi:hypothetical protein
MWDFVSVAVPQLSLLILKCPVLASLSWDTYGFTCPSLPDTQTRLSENELTIVNCLSLILKMPIVQAPWYPVTITHTFYACWQT